MLRFLILVIFTFNIKTIMLIFIIYVYKINLYEPREKLIKIINILK